MSKKFMYGIGQVCFKGKKIGYIEKNSWQNNGKKPEVAEVNAEQVAGSAVLIIPQSNGTFAPTFNLIQLDYENLQMALGGSLVYAAEDTDKKTPIGWTAPEAIIQLEGGWEIDLVSGQSIMIPNGTLLSAPDGPLTLTETAKIGCEIKIATPDEGGAPYAIFETEKIPKEWKTKCEVPAET